MLNMYRAIANSPSTYLTAGIDAVTTSITVGSVTGLPSGPNLVTIGNGENCETVLYQSIDTVNKILLNCTRGYEGSAQAWSINQPVARYFTAYDHNTFIANLIALDLQTRQSYLIPVKTTWTISRAGLAINPLLAYNPTSLTTVANNVIVDNGASKDILCYWSRLQARSDGYITFKTINEYTLNGAETL